MDNKVVLLEKQDGLAIITLNRPEVYNALNAELIEQLPKLIDEADRDEATRVVIITGVGNGFCSGADVRQLLAKQLENPPLMETVYGEVLRGKSSPMSMAVQMRNMGKPVIAAINGVAAGAGLSIALACDIRIASDKARFSMAFVRRGIIPDTGGTYYLPRLVGTARACELILTGDMIGAEEAERIGMVNRVVPHQELMKATKELGMKLVNNPPLAIKAAKQAIYHGLVAADLETHLNYELFTNGILTQTEDYEEGVKSFLEKREPSFKGR